MLFLCTENTTENNAFARESEEYDIMCLRVGEAQNTVKRGSNCSEEKRDGFEPDGRDTG